MSIERLQSSLAGHRRVEMIQLRWASVMHSLLFLQLFDGCFSETIMRWHWRRRRRRCPRHKGIPFPVEGIDDPVPSEARKTSRLREPKAHLISELPIPALPGRAGRAGRRRDMRLPRLRSTSMDGWRKVIYRGTNGAFPGPGMCLHYTTHERHTSGYGDGKHWQRQKSGVGDGPKAAGVCLAEGGAGHRGTDMNTTNVESGTSSQNIPNSSSGRCRDGWS
jgi:hypothetical protein